MGMKEEYSQKLRGRLADLDAEAKKLEAMAVEKGTEAEKELKKLMEKYAANREEIEQKLQKLQHTSKDAWKDMSEGIEKALEELKVAYSKASSRFK